MTSLAATSAELASLAADALILGLDSEGAVAPHAQLDSALAASIGTAAQALDASGKVGKVTVLPGAGLVAATRIVVVGIGAGTDADLREAAGAAARSIGKKAAKAVVALPAEGDRSQSAVAEGALLGAYTFTDYKSSEEEPADVEWLIAGASDTAIARAKVIAGAVAATRDLVNTPPLDLYPASFAEIAQGYAKEYGCDVRVWDANKLAEEGFGGLLGVGMGSSRLPRLVRIEHKGESSKGTVALVGKGITFDTGGISLKPPTSMETMKSDMSGAAAVMHTVLAAARMQLPITVVGWLCLAENMPSATAQRPSDVIRIYGGKTVEVLNTDAEGRLVMADGLARAIEENPDVVLDIATLTGAQGMALGTRTSGVMGDDAIRTEVVAAADAIAEDMWPMPLPAHLRESIDSKVADLRNIGDPKGGGMLSAGLFLKEFVGETPWAHLDIARPAFNEGAAYGYTVPGGTGAGVRTLLEFLERRAQA